MTCSMPPGNTYRPSARTQEIRAVVLGARSYRSWQSCWGMGSDAGVGAETLSRPLTWVSYGG